MTRWLTAAAIGLAAFYGTCHGADYTFSLPQVLDRLTASKT